MEFYDKSIDYTISYFNSDSKSGLTYRQAKNNASMFGTNVLKKREEKGFFPLLYNALKEPMLLILCFSFIISLGADLGQGFKTGHFDFSECLGILLAITLSVSITLIMEGSSKKAFNLLSRLYENITVKIIRDGKIELIKQNQVVCGDIVFLESGDKIIADGVLIDVNELNVDESALTGESHQILKSVIPSKISTHLAERKNCVFSGTFVTSGSGKMLVTAVGNNTEMGNIAKELSNKDNGDSPLNQKLYKLGKIISIIGLVSASVVFILSIIRLVNTNSFNFDNVGNLFITCIVLIVAAVPEGLPTIVAISLAINMIKLASENALIKKMIATETAGAVSVICTDKTGTLTENKMKVIKIVTNRFSSNKRATEKSIFNNAIYNSSAKIISEKNKFEIIGDATEKAILEYYNDKIIDIEKKRENARIKIVSPFTSTSKTMITKTIENSIEVEYIKGAREKIICQCNLSKAEQNSLIKDMEEYERKAKRILCFAHREKEDSEYLFDGFIVIADTVRKEVKKSVLDCKRAGIKVKMLTGDNVMTATSIAIETGIYQGQNSVVSASEIENISDEELEKIIDKISVIARSTPTIKLRVVKALKKIGEVVAVTGDGINDAPAIKNADVGFCMGKTGSEITKESADIILTDDSFFTVVKAISFGRNVYRNIQRFIIFQLSVNLSALIFITVSVIMGYSQPFNTLQLLWINIIMDGPPALTLGLEKASDKLMCIKPVRKDKSIVSVKMLVKIIFNGVYISAVLLAQYLFNFLSVYESEKTSVVFTLFILFQLFNAFNCRELGSESIFKGLSENKVMGITFLLVFLLHILIVQVFYGLFNISKMSMTSWIKCIGISFTIIAIWEIVKVMIRAYKKANVRYQDENRIMSE